MVDVLFAWFGMISLSVSEEPDVVSGSVSVRAGGVVPYLPYVRETGWLLVRASPPSAVGEGGSCQ